MGGIREDFLAAARVSAGLLREPAVVSAWDEPSALPRFTVGGLAGHLAYQVLVVPEAMAGPAPVHETVPVMGHYARVRWIEADIDDEINLRIRGGGDRLAADGPGALSARVEAALEELGEVLPGAENRAVHIPLWDSWSLRLDDLLLTRTLEMAVHCDDLAVSVDLPTPPLPAAATERVVDLLARLAVRRHGPVAVLRALSRAERAPATVAAF
ncbi:maleylpyruvate isomerase N-terminal domain-containing protein [Bailinhaonella thermotolerans]|uniref:Mycothiol-dependent maleylpyruvate isomerase metal-binding domain-containing protein n=1 Tax=Bailinhaonella thermotolerans TaxID=1070861 RepID=A0A3A4B1M6_9ACTN|nr:maleylpyruvate isomerase N-terminal domain-containing protein [Bailinhaonella thermotolerans]RJL31310.1 hypothetical protein D5H75_19875 [Bailinhaonella thermotolerans]